MLCLGGLLCVFMEIKLNKKEIGFFKVSDTPLYTMSQSVLNHVQGVPCLWIS